MPISPTNDGWPDQINWNRITLLEKCHTQVEPSSPSHSSSVRRKSADVLVSIDPRDAMMKHQGRISAINKIIANIAVNEAGGSAALTHGSFPLIPDGDTNQPCFLNEVPGAGSGGRISAVYNT